VALVRTLGVTSRHPPGHIDARRMRVFNRAPTAKEGTTMKTGHYTVRRATQTSRGDLNMQDTRDLTKAEAVRLLPKDKTAISKFVEGGQRVYAYIVSK
jgi:hypothetical protein